MNKAEQKKWDEKIQTSYELVKKNADYVWSHLDSEIELPQAILKFNDQDLIYGNSIIMIQGKEGTHKSRLAAAIATLMVNGDLDTKMLGFQKVTNDTYLTIYLDTERNKTHQLPLMLKQVKQDSKLDKNELRDRFILAPVSEVNRKERLHVMGKVFQSVGTSTSKTVVIIIDIVSDFVQDFNNLTFTNELIDVMHAASSVRDITFIVVLHENPGMADKARGHLGTELANKAATILQIGKTEVPEVFKVQVKKSRTTSVPPSILLKFDSVVNNLVEVTDEMLATKIKDPESFRFRQVLSDNWFDKIERQELLDKLIKALNWSERKVEQHLKKLVDDKTEFETMLGRTTLEKSRGKTTEYVMNFLEVTSESELNDDQPSKEPTSENPPTE